MFTVFALISEGNGILFVTSVACALQIPVVGSSTEADDLPAKGRTGNGLRADSRGSGSPVGPGAWHGLGVNAAENDGALGVLLAARLQAATGVPVGIIQVGVLPTQPVLAEPMVEVHLDLWDELVCNK